MRLQFAGYIFIKKEKKKKEIEKLASIKGYFFSELAAFISQLLNQLSILF